MRILIAGAGPTGLGAAWRLEEKGHQEWSLVEAADSPGGLSNSVLDPYGFTWDLGGHVLFSQLPYFNQLMDDLLGTDWNWHQRESCVWMRDRFIPYPLQNNIWRLPPDDVRRCVSGIREVQDQSSWQKEKASNFEEWILNHFGRGLAEVFMIPYNEKVWAYPPAQLGVGWMRDRVSPINCQQLLRNIELRKDETHWGLNSRFRYPKHGGMGAVWRALNNRLPQNRVHFNSSVIRIDPRNRRVWVNDGSCCQYDYLISTMPLDRLMGMIPAECLPDLSLPSLLYSSTHIIGLGFEGILPPEIKKTTWAYFPEQIFPFYRMTVLSNYSRYNVPDPARYWSLLCEVSESPQRQVKASALIEEVFQAILKIPFLQKSPCPASVWHCRLEYGYPTPFLERDPILSQLDTVLKEYGILSRGRFGGWKYEVSNQDHSVMQGKEAVDYILEGKEEYHYYRGGI
jgi:protoporphyrinogen oxidase